jgi:homoserine dehydrogenase
VPSKRLIANVEGAMNAVVVQGDAVGTTLYYGKGAGSEPTASAVVADLVDITRLHTADPLNRVPHLAFQPDAMSDLPVLPMSEVVTSYYLRLRVADQAGVLSQVTGLLAGAGISIDAVLQREADEVGGEGATSDRSDHPHPRDPRRHHERGDGRMQSCPVCWPLSPASARKS